MWECVNNIDFADIRSRMEVYLRSAAKLKRKCHFNEISITVCTESGQNDKFWRNK